MYQSFYNLTGKPFRLSPDPAFFFPSRGHKRALAYLRYGLHQNEGFVVITGAPGTGKTTLAQILLDEMGEKNIVVAHLTTTQLEADDMLRMVAASFGLRYENLDKAALLKTIESFLLARSREGKRALLVIDEAQNLPARSLEELRMLSNLQVGDKALLQTFMLGQVQFRNMLENPDLEQLRQRVIANFHLSPLAADESRRYIESRLKHVNWKNDPHFAEIAFEKIHEHTEGVPRRINMLCDRIMLFACMEETHNVTGELVDLVRKELEQEVSSAPLKVQGQDAHENKLTSGPVQPASSKEPAYNAKASLNAASQLAEELKTATQKNVSNTGSKNGVPNNSVPNNSVPKNNAEAFKNAESKVAGPKVPEVKVNEAKAPEYKINQPTAEEPEFASGRAKDTKRIEPKLPASFDSDNEDFIEITEDFINAFDKNMLITDDSNEAREKSLLSTSAKTSDKQPAAKTESTVITSGQGQRRGIKPGNQRNNQRDNQRDNKLENQQDKKAGPAIKPEEKTKDKPVLAKRPEREPAEQEMLGNTVKHKKLLEAETGDESFAINLTPEPPQISERDLFRVIPGGKNAGEAPGRASKIAAAAAVKATPPTEDVVLRRILRLALAFHRSPSSFPGLDDPTQPLPEGVSELLELAVSDDQVLTKISPAAVMGISPVMLRAAVRFFVRRTLFASKGDYYRTLGLPPKAPVADIERHYDLLMRLLRQDKQPGAAECVDRVGRAYEELMRLDDVPAKSYGKETFQEPGNKAAAVLEALENPELTIDFGEEFKQDEQPRPVSAYFGAGNEGYIPDPRIARRRIHLLGQAAILGIGALVIVLGIFITQLEPTPESIESKPISNAPRNTVAGTPAEPGEQRQRRLDLLSDDGGMEPSAFPDQGDQASASSKVAAAVVALEKESAPARPLSSEEIADDDLPVTVTAKAETATTKSNEPIVLPVQKAGASVPVQEFKPAAAASASSQQAPAVAAAAQAATDTGTRSVLQQATPLAIGENPATSKFTPVTVQDKTAAAAAASAALIVSDDDAAGDTATSTESAAEASLEAAPVVTESIDAITQPMLDQLLADFVKAFDSGNLDNLMTMFAASSRTNTQTTKQGIENEYRQLFSNTASRTMVMTASTWNNEGRFARGVGQYSVALVPQAGSPLQVKGEYTLQLQFEDGKVTISRLYLSEDLPVARIQAATGPSQVELKSLLSSFTEAYENGDVNRLMNLFATNAQTNDQTTLAGIRQDHVDLFNTTEARQMFLKDVKWDIKGDTATGKGSFEVLVQAKGQTSFASVKGAINLEAVKTTDGVKLSKFFHQTN
ncbi:MAG TPA: XrtA/PEP-CTERM system-associated ATPase [Gammaproteobacteria bacterium]